MYSLVISCEHAGNAVPDAHAHLFAGKEDVLNTHRGWDPGALPVAENLAHRFHVPLFACYQSRLLIEVNRALISPQLFSEFSTKLPAREKQSLIDTVYLPFRQSVEGYISVSPKPVLHLSVHTFTPVWAGNERAVDIGILFDPDREGEQTFSTQLHSALSRQLPDFRIRYNEPYAGKDDGHTTHLRTKFSSEEYLGIELEINQKFHFGNQLSHLSQKIEEFLLPLVR